jgi:hypothetical protein
MTGEDPRIAAMRNGWLRRTFGRERWHIQPGAARLDGSGLTRCFYGRTAVEALRKSVRDFEANGTALALGDDGHDAEALRLQRARGRAAVDPARDCPPCPACSMPCGSTGGSRRDEPGGDCLECLACGHSWAASEADLEQARRADDAYNKQLEAEEAEEAERDARLEVEMAWERLPAKVRETNRRMLEQLEHRRPAPAGEQLSLLGGEP